MLQQTQVSRVLKAYPEFLERFPDFTALSGASTRSVIVAWRGMGYNNRAVRLREVARLVRERYGGRLPQDEKTLSTLPGIGKYTARAVQVSAFGKPVAAVDVNARRVLSRYFSRMRSTRDLAEVPTVWQRADKLVPRDRAYDWNQALMDLGSEICTARAPGCERCPLLATCASGGKMKNAEFRKTKHEPSLEGIPNRMYRGRIIETLRSRKSPVALPAIGRAIHPRFGPRNARWLERLVVALERDGLIRVSGNGSFQTRKVSLV